MDDLSFALGLVAGWGLAIGTWVISAWVHKWGK